MTGMPVALAHLRTSFLWKRMMARLLVPTSMNGSPLLRRQNQIVDRLLSKIWQRSSWVQKPASGLTIF